MNEYVYYTIFFIIMLIGFVATIMVGFSKRNREGDPTYDKKTGLKWIRLSLIYAVVIVAAYLVLYMFIRQ
jgi:hypothetical protein